MFVLVKGRGQGEGQTKLQMILRYLFVSQVRWGFRIPLLLRLSPPRRYLQVLTSQTISMVCVNHDTHLKPLEPSSPVHSADATSEPAKRRSAKLKG